MASIRQLNQPGSYWDVIANMEDHPFFAGLNHNHIPGDETDQSGPGGFPFGGQFAQRGRHGPHHHGRRHHRESETEDDEETAQEETNDENEEASSSSDDDNNDNDAPRGSEPHRGHRGHGHGRHGGGFHAKGGRGGHGRGGHGRGRHGHGPKGFGGPGTWGFGHPAEFGPWGGPHEFGPHGHGGFGPHGFGHHGFGPRDFGHHGFGLHRGYKGFGPHGGFGPGPHCGGRGSHGARFSPWGGKPMKGFKHGKHGKHHHRGFGFGPFGHKMHHFDEGFHPEVDVYDTPEFFVVHASLPGAKKDAVEVKWDPKKFELNISGVIERPGGEEVLKTLALDERRVGEFDRKVRLGSVAQPVEINVEGITAEMENGVLSVKLPKVEADVVMVTKVDIQ
ncbi:HSP20-like chaperone [Aspergillus heteromorphus CBS 117.55]|uniref:HSP20-like chaperone n=1 Tax=Aspergillus heteromorphus CBS 117.55 TaxID=1448321 RepID=A0A317V6H4_9EURO|nr:HSP20-like chaperone [Aspergillus heteromorphus CBS 117.55]PWY68648.1 HSP20-like chaperone [Aspergillus heteromorphus CBS 117.55]